MHPLARSQKYESWRILLAEPLFPLCSSVPKQGFPNGRKQKNAMCVQSKVQPRGLCFESAISPLYCREMDPFLDHYVA